MTYFTVAGLQLNLKDRQNLDQFTDKVRATKRRFPFVQMIVGSELSICGAGVNYAGYCPKYVNIYRRNNLYVFMYRWL